MPDSGIEQRGLGFVGFVTSPGVGGGGEGVDDLIHRGKFRHRRDDRFAGRPGGSAGMEDHLTDTIEADRGFGFPVRVGGVVGQGEFEVGVGALAVSGVEGDPDRLRRVDGRLGEAGTAGGERVVVGDESQRRALAHGLDADEVRRDFEAG